MADGVAFKSARSRARPYFAMSPLSFTISDWLNVIHAQKSVFCSNVFIRPYYKLNGRAYGTMLCPFVVCNVAPAYVLWRNGTSFTEKLSEEANRVACPLHLWYQFGLPTTSFSPKRGYWLHSKILALRIAAKPFQLSAWLGYYWQSIKKLTNVLSNQHGHLFPKI